MDLVEEQLDVVVAVVVETSRVSYVTRLNEWPGWGLSTEPDGAGAQQRY